jgi:hypothetical protein
MPETTSASENRRIIVDFDRARGCVQESLRATAGPINKDSTDAIADIESLDALEFTSAFEAKTAVEGPVPYGLHLFPYSVLKELGRRGGLAVIADSPDAIEAAADTFQPKRVVPRRWNGKSVEEDMAEKADAQLRHALYAVAAPEATSGWERAVRSCVSKEVSCEAWAQYMAIAPRLEASGDGMALESIAYLALRSIAFSEDFGVPDVATGRHNSFLFTTKNSMLFNGFLQLPITPYGPALTKRLALTSSYMANFALHDHELLNNGVTAENDYLIRRYTTRARAYDASTTRDSFVGGVIEADQQSLPAALLMLASSRVRGFDQNQGEALIGQIINDDLPDELALLARQALTASSAVNGMYIENLVHMRRDGHLEISAEGRDRLQALQEISDGIGARAIKEYASSEATKQVAGKSNSKDHRSALHVDMVRTFRACPFAGIDRTDGTPKPGAITNRSRAFLSVFERVVSTRDLYFRS